MYCFPQEFSVIDFLHPNVEMALKDRRTRWGLGGCVQFRSQEAFFSLEERDSTECAVLAFLLHGMPIPESLKLVETARERFHHVLLLDYKVPERNLDFPAYWIGGWRERLGPHYRQYHHYMRHGGIEGLIRDLRLIPYRRDVFWGGGVGLLWLV